jgi:hypothetical protein
MLQLENSSMFSLPCLVGRSNTNCCFRKVEMRQVTQVTQIIQPTQVHPDRIVACTNGGGTCPGPEVLQILMAVFMPRIREPTRQHALIAFFPFVLLMWLLVRKSSSSTRLGSMC